MAKGRVAITQLTASATSITLDVSAAYSQTLYLKHSNGTGAVTTAGTARVDVKTAGGTLWYALQTVAFSAVAAQADDRVIPLPDDAASVRVVYTQPVGPTGFTLDGEAGTTA